MCFDQGPKQSEVIFVFRRTFIAGVALATLTATGAASEEKMTAAEILALLNGNTIIGSWSGTAYRSYYGDGGLTIYAPEGGQPERGRWRVNEETDQYESWWEHSGWTPYSVVRTDDGGYAWLHSGELQPFSVLEGRQISF